MLKEAKVIFPAFSMIVGTRFLSILHPNTGQVSKGSFYETTMPLLSALSSPENLVKDGVTTEDPVLRSTWQVAGQNRLQGMFLCSGYQ